VGGRLDAGGRFDLLGALENWVVWIHSSV
jgi:hypothetical protein